MAHSTVSRALAGNPRIPEATRRRIQARATELGWKPNPLASAYMVHVRSSRPTGFQASLAWIITEDRPDFARLSGYHRAALAGAKARAKLHGYKIEPFWLRDLGFDGNTLSRVLKSRGIPGVVFNADGLPDEFAATFDWPAFATASWGRRVMTPQLHHAASHNFRNLSITEENLRRLGYSRRAIILSEGQDILTDHAYYSAAYFLEKQTLSKRDGWTRFFPVLKRYSQPQERILRWLEKNRPQVVVGDDLVWGALMDAGWKVPGDIAFASPFWDVSWPKTGGLDQRSDLIGANAVDLVAGQLTQNERGVPGNPKIVLNEGCWKDGASVPSLAKK